MKFKSFLFFTLALLSATGLSAQPIESATFVSSETEQDPVTININTQLYDSWEISGNIEIGKTVWRSENDEPEVNVFFLDEAFDPAILDELTNLDVPEVPLTRFTASMKDAKVNLDWTSANNEMVNSFFIQRSIDTENWTDIGMISGDQTDPTFKDYQFTDNSPVIGSNYYRLKQISATNDMAFSNPIAVEAMDQGIHVMHMYPNPLIFGASIDLELFQTTRVKILLKDSKTQTIGTIYSKLTSLGKHSVEINLDNLPRGEYICEIQVGDSISTRNIRK